MAEENKDGKKGGGLRGMYKKKGEKKPEAKSEPKPKSESEAKPAPAKGGDAEKPGGEAKADPRAAMLKRHETERRDLHGNHRDEMRKTHARHEKEIKEFDATQAAPAAPAAEPAAAPAPEAAPAPAAAA